MVIVYSIINVSAMLEKYDVDEATAKADVSAFIDMIRGAGFLDE